ncbi:hypothetical protein BDV93DRAFT_432029 [Ceratobasidium sp. AG-I]|nr:hypothetical protein BDV93DRAFT_432029 [Ceratobasidium sp. AG-I]
MQLVPRATNINLGHNPLGDGGLSLIIEHLCLDQHKNCVQELNLNNCGISDWGLMLLSRYIDNNTSLRRLFLMGNMFIGSSGAVQKFTAGLNSSRIQTLVLTNNDTLTDKFLRICLERLNAPYLREMQLSSIGLTQSSLPVLSRFLSSPACYGLRTLHLNGNSLSNRGLKELVSELLVSNTTLCIMEAYANSVAEAEEDEDGDMIPDVTLGDTIRQALTIALARNQVYLRKVEAESKALLGYARTLLLGAEYHGRSSNSKTLAFPWTRLAPELQCYILRFVHTSLSDAQHTRVCKYGAEKSTLPPFSPFYRHTKSRQEYIEDFLIEVGCNRFEGELP